MKISEIDGERDREKKTEIAKRRERIRVKRMRDKNSGREIKKVMRDIQGSVKAEYEKERKRKR